MTPFDDLALLRMFVRIVEAKSISAAARSLRVPQPTLSRHLRTLEDRASTTLLLRDTHRLRLTEAGHRLLADARGVLALADEATERLRDERDELRGHLRVFSTVDFGQRFVARVLARFLRDHPGMTAELVYSNRPVPLIEHGHDAGIVAGAIADDTVVARRIGELERIVVAAPTHPVVRTPDELRDHRWLALSQQQFGGPVSSVTLRGPRGVERIVATTPVLVAEGVTALREAALEGLGLCVVPRWLVRDDLAAGTLIHALPDWQPLALPFSVIHLADRTLPRRVRSFLDFAATEMVNELAAANAPPTRSRRSPARPGR